MVKVTIELVRKKAEHHDGELAPLVEISLHQEKIEKIELIQNLCPKLQILLLQSNLIPKIENLHKLKELEYLNLAINNIEIIENLEKLESLKKLDLTLNFIGDLTSVESLKNNYNLQTLYLTGNPCTDYEGYRDFVIGTLPQLISLDCVEIKRSERITATRKLDVLRRKIIYQQEIYAKKREAQKIRIEKEIKNKWTDELIDDEERIKRFWNEKSEHCPETRIQIEKFNELQEKLKNKREEITTNKKEKALFAPDGRPYNINESKLHFTLDESDPKYIQLELFLYKYLDTTLIEVDMQPFYVKVIVKGKIFQLALSEEINLEKSSAQRSLTTGHLLITMMKLKQPVINSDQIINAQKSIRKQTISNDSINDKRELLEIGSSHNILDFTKLTISKNKSNINTKVSVKPELKLPSSDFIDNPQVPPLI